MTIAIAPWLAGFAGMGIGYPLVGNTWWLTPFAFIPLVLTYIAIWPKQP